MTRVLLIADTQRVQRIFHRMAEQGLLQLQTASTLALGEFELSDFSPDITFVQSRISGFSGDILLRHLDKMLPSGGRLVLLAGDSEDAAQAERHGRTSLDLTMDDALLERCAAALLTGEPLPDVPLREEPQPVKVAPAKVRKAAPAVAAQEEPPQSVVRPEPEPAELEQAAAAETTPAAVVASQPLPEEPAGAGEYPPLRVSGKSAASAFEEVMQQAEAKSAPMDAALAEVEDRIEVRAGAPRQEFFEETLPAPPALDGAAKGAGGYYAGETVAEALRRAEQKKRRSPWLFIVPVLVVVAIPVASYLAGRRSAPEQATMPAAKPAVKPAPAPAAPSAPAPAAPQHAPGTSPGAAPAPSQALPSAATPAAKAPAAPQVPAATPLTPPAGRAQGAAPAKSAPRRGMENLPAMLEGTKLDAEYGKKHPGWVRYLGIRAEYKLFKENNLYRAIQVIPVPGGTVSDDLFKRVLRQFGGADSYRVESSAAKGDYLVEQCATHGPAALTIYRNKTNNKVKALVVYYP
ncbi:hypothetical protein KP004_20695 [Geomonas oryzisoli]|uniref:Response regulatory domain-containing protein n=1 Tax=Geomonas oryzisoli TaxID=2847992 RepID=A0ABX8J513_9BACT|nr:hypothetical protein [Geomonas oryzisoli]QWV93544.1 hypothetical protein KP004_20695 [Geomonas oryzisoli]